MATPNLNNNIDDLENPNADDILDLEKGLNAHVHEGTSMRKNKKKKKNDDDDDDDDSADAQSAMGLMMLFLYYVFYVFYMMATCEEWWHAALGIGIATAFLLLSFCCLMPRNNKPANSQKKKKTPSTTQTDLSTILLSHP
ncbi:hypothetical protein OsI_36906 [Oryza sativa Indica Group]|uniref:Transmembrane protein n=4 Tax=Oryza TaxID=4527 RepID=A0A8J8XCY1_ORYSJ|nr:hypothetical protein LOC_Os11g43720 [Oryza sativa Japonica Group]EAY81733.1 hypothetical protein OsI_36906 [Oryza sativa Indica Group]EAZ19176.1 hypothetical protein OsJ_34714 [Oryza sativa Japonica Group]